MVMNIILLVIITIINVSTLLWDKYVFRMKEKQLKNANESSIDQLSKGAEIRVGKPLSDEEKEIIRQELEQARKIPFYKRISGLSFVLFGINILLAGSVAYSYIEKSDTVQIQKVYDVRDYTSNYTQYMYEGNTPKFSKNTKTETVKLYETKIDGTYYLKGYSEYSGNFFVQLNEAEQEDAILKITETNEIVDSIGVAVYKGTILVNTKAKKLSFLPLDYKKEQ